MHSKFSPPAFEPSVAVLFYCSFGDQMRHEAVRTVFLCCLDIVLRSIWQRSVNPLNALMRIYVTLNHKVLSVNFFFN